MKLYRVRVEGPGSPTYFRTSYGPHPYLERVPRLGPSASFSKLDNFFVLEQALVDGSLPDPSPAWEKTGRWIAPYQWDMLVYMWSNADIHRTTDSFSGLRAASVYTGLNRDIKGQRKEQGRRKRDLFVGLESAGLMEEVRRSGTRTYRQLRLAPVWLPDGPVPSGVPRTWANLSAPDRKWFKMALEPFSQPSGSKVRCHWAELEHSDRRALAALYLYFNDKEFGAVDPNHVCLRDGDLVVSDAFRLAIGRGLDADGVARALGELWRRKLIAFLTASFSDDRPYPGAPSHIRYAVRETESPNAVIGLKYVPKPGDFRSPHV